MDRLLDIKLRLFESSLSFPRKAQPLASLSRKERHYALNKYKNFKKGKNLFKINNIQIFHETSRAGSVSTELTFALLCRSGP